ncbi:MAG: tRNA (uridine(34)/cytosine(34)/5-carboxymethylaminomethyluridine(34)-2'-O)-methyltransferase TrmL [Eubacterium sp.]
MEYELNIALIEPEIPQNTGNIARTCAATGARLHLVGPMGFQITDKQVKRAGLDYWDKLSITYYDSTQEFFERNKGGKFYYFTTKAEITHSDMKYENGAFLVFGKETKGLPEELLKANHDSCVRLPMRGIIRSLNLSNAVCVGTYEVLRQWGYPELSLKGQLHNLKW